MTRTWTIPSVMFTRAVHRAACAFHESAARLLDKLGAIVTVNDGKPFEENPAAQSLLEEGIKVVTASRKERTPAL